MILYLDASALVKRYVAEKESEQVNDWIEAAEIVVTGLITRVEVPAAITRAQRMKLIDPDEAKKVVNLFRSEWESLHRLPINENTVIRGDFLACEYKLRGYDAVHLACALIFHETLGFPVTLATFDIDLASAVKKLGMVLLPD